jgi:two-component system sensor histidine kinase/response regulator
VSKPIDPDELWQALLSGVRLREGLGLAATSDVQAGATPDPLQPGALLSELRTVSGLDVGQGLRLCNHNADLYVSMLGKFVKSQAQAMLHVREALATDDAATAERLAHTLKGLAASLGAEPLRMRAAELEHRLHAGAGQPLGSLIAQTEAQLNALVAGLRATPGLVAETVQTVRTSLTQAEHAQVQGVVQALRQMLEQDDSEAAVLWQSHAPDLRAALNQAAALEQAIAGFDFEEALRLLQEQV